jgi:hypothetical protein
MESLFISGAQLRAPPGYSNALGIAGLLPLELDVLRIDFPDPDNLNTFTLGATGHFLIDELAALLPFTPILYIGDPVGIGHGGVTTVTPGSSNGSFDFDFDVQSLRNGTGCAAQLRTDHTGHSGSEYSRCPSRWTGHTGRLLKRRVFDDSFSGFLKVIAANDGTLLNVNFSLQPSTLTFNGNSTTLDLHALATLAGNNALSFGLVVEATRLQNSPFIRFDRIEPTIDSVTIGSIVFQIGNFLRFTSNDVVFVSAPGPGQP